MVIAENIQKDPKDPKDPKEMLRERGVVITSPLILETATAVPFIFADAIFERVTRSKKTGSRVAVTKNQQGHERKAPQRTGALNGHGHQQSALGPEHE